MGINSEQSIQSRFEASYKQTGLNGNWSPCEEVPVDMIHDVLPCRNREVEKDMGCANNDLPDEMTLVYGVVVADEHEDVRREEAQTRRN
ncbi:unnamed protein product [Allacma fusca]|uniref:Uncharacterized protein n=1 Tax=Allacma fusca TaxID=39272 RepID=A0A8J2LNF0_9HEXA|nr:unnamed protein product [Allacma fusca]